jgi:hypothetical protein
VLDIKIARRKRAKSFWCLYTPHTAKAQLHKLPMIKRHILALYMGLMMFKGPDQKS